MVIDLLAAMTALASGLTIPCSPAPQWIESYVDGRHWQAICADQGYIITIQPVSKVLPAFVRRPQMQPTLNGTSLPIRYIGLDEEHRRQVSNTLLQRLGKYNPDQERFLTYDEAKQLTEEDFSF